MLPLLDSYHIPHYIPSGQTITEVDGQGLEQYVAIPWLARVVSPSHFLIKISLLKF